MTRDYVTAEEASTAHAQEPLKRFFKAQAGLTAAKQEMAEATNCLWAAVKIGAELLDTLDEER